MVCIPDVFTFRPGSEFKGLGMDILAGFPGFLQGGKRLMGHQAHAPAVGDQGIARDACRFLVCPAESSVDHHQPAPGFQGAFTVCYLNGGVAVDNDGSRVPQAEFFPCVYRFP